jgi:hypothetical protein
VTVPSTRGRSPARHTIPDPNTMSETATPLLSDTTKIAAATINTLSRPRTMLAPFARIHADTYRIYGKLRLNGESLQPSGYMSGRSRSPARESPRA